MKKIILCIICLVSIAMLMSCQSKKEEEKMADKKLFGKLPDGREVYIFKLKNAAGIEAEIINFGAAVVTLKVPDKNGKLADIVSGFDNIEGYLNNPAYFGVIVGRCGNRIAKGQFTLEGKTYQLAKNDGTNQLHGGVIGFHKVLWNAEPLNTDAGEALKLTYFSKDGEEGYPGNLTLTVTYTLTKDNELRIDYTGTTDKTTVLNPTHHSYFNLTGDFNNTILKHQVWINADRTTPVDNGLIPTGKITPVEGTPLDFRTPTEVGARINNSDEQIKFGRGYDFNWVLNDYNGKVTKIASAYEPQSGRLMEVFSDQPGVQFYTGNFLDGTIKGKGGHVYNYRTGLCFEAQHFPDSPNQPQFPTVVLKPGETYNQTTTYKFSVK